MALRSLPLLLTVLLPLFHVSPGFAGSFDEHISYGKKHLRILNLIGEVRISKAEGSSFEVVVHVQGKDATHERIQVKLDEAAGNLVVHYPLAEGAHFVYPALGPGSRSTFFWDPDHRIRHIGLKDLIGLGDHRRITVTGSGSAPEMWADIEVHVPAKGHLELVDGVGAVNAAGVEADLDLELQNGGMSVERVAGDVSADTGSGSVTISTVNGRVNADSGSGRVAVESVNGDLSVDTGSGSVTIVRAHGTKIHADTGSGSVHLSDIVCTDLKVDTGSGGIHVQNADIGSGHFDTGSGGVDLVIDQLHGGPIRVDTGSGSVSLDLPPDPSATVSASTAGGGIRVDLDGVDWVTNERDEKTFRVGKGEAQISLETGSGSIRVRS